MSEERKALLRILDAWLQSDPQPLIDAIAAARAVLAQPESGSTVSASSPAEAPRVDDRDARCRAGTEYSDAELVKRAVTSAYYGRLKDSRWYQVGLAFACGSTLAKGLCRRFGFDPDERVGLQPHDAAQPEA